MKIYTKTGDKGETGIIGKRLSKNSNTINLIGSLDELNSSLGVAASNTTDLELRKELQQIQSTIFLIGSLIAAAKIKEIEIDEKFLEKRIDFYDSKLPKLQNFILPGGSTAGSLIHHARSVCRRTERSFINFKESETYIDSQNEVKIQKYLNRLSDYLFTLARYVNMKEGVDEIIWKGK